MEELHWPLTLLSRAIHYKNLTHAAAHVGISQPQLSRVISKLEEELSVVLLDRESKRSSSWTSEALKLGELYSHHSSQLQKSIEALLEDNYPKEVSIGVLEGLIEVASRITHSLIAQTEIETVRMDVFDLSDLQNKFSRGELDIVFSSGVSGEKKQNRVLELGFQTLDWIPCDNAKINLLSVYEKTTLKRKTKGLKTLVSNSLAIKKHWLRSFAGQGQLPSSVLSKKTSRSVPVYLVANEHLNIKLWQKIKEISTI